MNVAVRKPAENGSTQHLLIIRNRPERHRHPSSLRHGGRYDGTVAVVNCGGTQGLTRLDQFIASREHGNPRLSDGRDRSDPAGRQHANLARSNRLASTQ